MVTIEARPGTVLRLGYTGEHLARCVRFPIKGWRDTYGEGTAALLARRSGDKTPYPVQVVAEGDYVLWDIQSADTQNPGTGECQLRYIVGERVAKEAVFITEVNPSMADPGTPPVSPEKTYLDKVLTAGSTAQTAAQSASASAKEAKAAAAKTAEVAQAVEAVNGMTVAAETLGAGAEATVHKETVNGAYKLTFGIPAGEQGPVGPQGAPFTYENFTEEQLAALVGPAGVGITDVRTTSRDTYERITLVLSDGSSHVFTVPHGEDGADGKDGADGADGAPGVSLEVKGYSFDSEYTYVRIGPVGSSSYTTVRIPNGKDGADGADGAQGPKGDTGEQGEQGLPGIYLGSGDMPEGYYVQLDPEGEADGTFEELVEQVAEAMPGGGTSGGITEETDPTVPAWAKTDLTATVGQYFRVSSVDSDGKVTAVEAVDAPSGGGGGGSNEWRLIQDIILTEEAATITVNSDGDGNAISLKKVKVYVSSIGGSANTDKSSYYIYPNSTNAASLREIFTNGVYAAGKTVNSSFTIEIFRADKTYYGIEKYANKSSAGGSINSYGQETSIKSVNMYCAAEGFTFGVNTKIVVWGIDA